MALLRISVTLLCIHGAFAAPAPAPAPDEATALNWNPTSDTYLLYFHKDCKDEQIVDIRLGWAEAGLLANAINNWRPAGAYQNAMNKYMGTDSAKSAWLERLPSYNIRSAITNAFTMHNGGPTASNTEAYFYCDAASAPGDLREACDKGVVASATPTWGVFWNLLELVICPPYYRATSLGDILKQINLNNIDRQSIRTYYGNKGHVMYHELLHWDPTISALPIKDTGRSGKAIYGPDAVAAEAEDYNADSTQYISDAYSITALAIYAMRLYGLNDPPDLRQFISGIQGDAFKYVGPDFRNNSGTDPPHNPDEQNAKPDMTVWKTSSDNKLPDLDPEVYGRYE